MNMLNLPGSVALLLALSSTAWALECPVLAAIDDPAVAATVQQLLPGDTDLEAPDALRSAVFELKQAGVADDLILDNLIAVYCGAINALPDVSDDDKSQRVEAFTQSATQVVFTDAD
jgi:hypothetical protein